MNEHKPTSNNTGNINGGKDNYLKGLNLQEEYSKFGIGNIQPDEIITNIHDCIKQGEEIEKESKNIFPVEVFPLPIQEIIQATNQSLTFPIDFISVSILYSASLAIGNTHKVEVMKSWQESAVLYLALVGQAGTNKSHPLTFALQPISDQDAKTYRVYEKLKQEYDQAIKLSKKEREQQGIKEPVKSVWQKYIVSDFTPEALAEVHKFNKRGIGVYADELASWVKNFNRYNQGAEQEFWLSAWSAKPINIDRKTGEPVFVAKPFISVIGTIQQGVLIDISKNGRTQNGFIDRILFAIPDSLQKQYWSETTISSSIVASCKNILEKLLQLPCPLDDTLTPQAEVLTFDTVAKKRLLEWQRSNTDQCNNAETEAIGSIYSKLEMYAVRLSLILEMLRWACGESYKQTINLQSVEGAIHLVEYFRKTALKVHNIISNHNPLDKLSSDKQKLYEALPAVFTTEAGLQLAKTLGVPERTFKRFLNEQELFHRISRGEYEKRI